MVACTFSQVMSPPPWPFRLRRGGSGLPRGFSCIRYAHRSDGRCGCRWSPGPVAAAVGCAARQVREALGAALAGRAPALNEDLVVTPNDFITKWRASELKERSASQEHFIDLCRLLGEPTPADADPTGETYCFERGARRDAGGDGWADVWKRHHFAWEYKGRRANLDAAFNQLRQYALALENPPLLTVSDMVRFRIRSARPRNCSSRISSPAMIVFPAPASSASRNRTRGSFSRWS